MNNSSITDCEEEGELFFGGGGGGGGGGEGVECFCCLRTIKAE